MFKRFYFGAAIVAALCGCDFIEKTVIIESPDGQVVVTFSLAESSPYYSVSFHGADIIRDSPLGLELHEGGALAAGLMIADVRRKSHDETWKLVVGKSSTARDHYNEATIALREKAAPHRRLDIAFRAYDDGAAFRYCIPKQKPIGEFGLVSEKSEFCFVEDADCWALSVPGFRHSYEGSYDSAALRALPNGLLGLPLTLQRRDGIVIALTEADLTDYAGMYFQAQSDKALSLKTVLSPLPSRPDIAVKARTPHRSPWRVIMLGTNPGDLIESNLILNLNESCAIADVSWIKPGKVIFPWWPNFRAEDPILSGRFNFANQKYYIDFAAEMGIEYLELEPPWYGDEADCIAHPEKYDISRPIPELELPRLLDYAKEKNVGFFIWAHWKSVDAQMDSIFDIYERWGAKGMKIDFMDRDDQEMVNWYHRILDKAAEHHLMVYFHGAYKPTGTRRTWPNLITREGVMGEEYAKWSDRITPEHNVTLPFTRMLVGPMDYTPGAFNNVTREQFKPVYDAPMMMNTRCQELAKYVVYESELMAVADYPGAYRAAVGNDFIRRVPSSWDEIRVVAAQIADYIAIARKSGDTWYLGAMTDSNPRTLELPLDFLDEGEYSATIYADGTEADHQPQQVAHSTRLVNAASSLTAEMASGGGYAVILDKR